MASLVRRLCTAIAFLLLVAAPSLTPLPLRAQPGEGAAERATGASLLAEAVRTLTPPRIDGRLDEEEWQSAPILSGFIQNAPFEGRPASERTEVRILFDDDALYIGAWLYDSNPAGILQGESRRDASLNETDAFVLIFDTYHDRQNGFVFGTTPAGIEYDGQVTREGQGGGGGDRMQRGSGGGFNLNWDGSWEVATSRDGEGWYAEFRIPFSTLRYGGAGPQQWGVNFSRKIRRKSEEAFWAPLPRQYNLHRVSLAGTLTGLEAPARRSLTVTPYLLSSGSRSWIADPVSTDYAVEVGGDVKVGLGPNLTLDLTVNTDFAQVEVDDQQINLTRFNLFFPEKRPFFLENAGTFSAGTPQAVELFFSRRIGIERGREAPIRAGGRLTGTVGSTALGLLSVQTGAVEFPDPVTGELQPWSPANHVSVARALRALPNRSQVGTILVSRLNTDDTDDYNLTYGVDGRWGIGDHLTLDGYLARTTTPDVGGPATAGAANATLNTPDWRAGASYREVQRGFNPEVGFLPRTEYRFVQGSIMRRFRLPEVRWLQEVRPHINYREHFDLDGFSESRWIHIDSHFEFSNGAFIELPALNLTREGLKAPFTIHPGVVVPAGTYDNVEMNFAWNTNRSATLSAEGRVEFGGFYDGTRRGGSLALNFRGGDRLVTSGRVQYYDVRLAGGDFETMLLTLRAAWSFTPRVYLQSLVQYNDQTRNLSSNVRFGWLNTAGTGLFVVFNDLDHRGPFHRTGMEPGPMERTLVIKFTRQLAILE